MDSSPLTEENVLSPKWTARLRRGLTLASSTTAAVLALALPASAHTPVMLDETDTVPWTSPRAVDGNAPMSFYGTLPNSTSWRSFQFTITDTAPGIEVNTFIPDLAPENTYAANDLPTVIVLTPDYKVITVRATMRIPVPIEEINQNYLLVGQYSGPAVAGTYSVVVVGAQPARFNISTGHEGLPEAGVVNGEEATFEQIQQWYATAP